MNRRSLDLTAAGWTLTADPATPAWDAVPAAIRERLGAGIPATVPGVVHADLMAAGLLADPYIGRAELDQMWVGDQTWTYRGRFALDPDGPELAAAHADLVCDGLDTLAEVTLNGHVLGRTANQHRRYTFDVVAALQPGDNVLEVRFDPAVPYAAGLLAELGPRPHPPVLPYPFNTIRKMACNFGWDWGPILITAGIWKPLRLVTWDTARLAEASVLATAAPTADGWSGDLCLRAHVTGNLAGATVTVELAGPGTQATAPATAQATAQAPAQDWTDLHLPIAEIDPWWPHDLGAQPLYDVTVTVTRDGATLDQAHYRTGFRATSLDTTPDPAARGEKFALNVNGVEIFVRGANWIPDDCFPSRVTPQRYRERIQQAKEAHIDLLRVWGGGLYEQDAFYDACDELGMMVWQDFALASNSYPEEEPIWSEIEAEIRDNIVRLAPHPSLMIWNGNNECILARTDWGWETQEGFDRTWGAGYFYDLFPRLLAELDPSRPYWAGSPSSGAPDRLPNDPDYGCVHIWDVWNSDHYTAYDHYAPRFASEFGYQGPATYATWARTLDPADRSATSPAMLLHQRAEDGNGKLNFGIAGFLPQPGETVASFDAWLYTMQVQQARAVRYGVERWRSLRGRCHGSIVWQLNDCWPVTSWAALDSGTNAAGATVARRKPLWYALRSVYADRIATLQLESGAWRLALVNDGVADWRAVGTVELRRLTGETVWSEPLDAVVASRSRADVAVPGPAESAGLAWCVTLDGAERYVKLLAPDTGQDLRPPQYDATVRPTSGGVAVAV
ncbi:MAG: glycoside hydrolase family 2 protein, partial [Propionibacteriaceae bacterium]|nr:glycoside hydrolase family 2 protein [Propionibacteriaceae bacterium]